MSIIDLLVTIIVVTILVTIVLAVVTYIAYKLRLARRPAMADAPGASRYFDVHSPEPAAEPAGPDAPTWVLEREPAEDEAEAVRADARAQASEAGVEGSEAGADAVRAAEVSGPGRNGMAAEETDRREAAELDPAGR